MTAIRKGTESFTGPLARNAGWYVFVVACVVRLAAGLVTRRLLHPELFEYDGMAMSLLAGDGLAYNHLRVIYHSFAPPLYPWLSAASYWIFGSLIPLMFFQVIASGTIASVSLAIAGRLSPGGIAPLAAGLLVAVHPGLIICSISKAHPLTCDALFFCLAVLQAFRLRERTTMRRAVELGVIDRKSTRLNSSHRT